MGLNVRIILMAMLVLSCETALVRPERNVKYDYGSDIPHDMIVLGDRLENPYKTENMTKALQSLYSTKAERVELETTDLYVRFLPVDDQEYELLEDLGLHLFDHPLDYEVVVEGDWYHDPDLPEESVTWQYAVVPKDFEFPDVAYEIIDQCYLVENDTKSKAEWVDWEAVEYEAYRLTGNEDMIAGSQTKASKHRPSGRITIVDEEADGGKPFGVAGVTVSCNAFVRMADCCTDRDGYYSMNKSFSSNLRYRLVFKNQKGFSIGMNLVIVPASVSTLGKSGPEGVSMTVTRDSEDKLFRRCAVNNAAYAFYSRCCKEDLGVTPPPADLRIWLMNSLHASSAVMLHHGAILKNDLLVSFLGKYSPLIQFLAPDITIGTKGREDYASLFNAVNHELAHASHFVNVGRDFWDAYILYIIESFVMSGGMEYGDGTADGAGHCEVGEMWAYYLESKMYKDRYGGAFPSYGSSFWFYPQIFRYMDERGVSSEAIYSVLTSSVTTREHLRDALLRAIPSRKTIIEQAFSRY